MNTSHYRLMRELWGPSLPIVDAKMNGAVTIKAVDLRRGQKGDPRKCSLALALDRDYGKGSCLAFLDTTFILNKYDARVYRYRNSAALRRDVIHPLDRGEMPTPGTYNLLAPKGTGRMGQAKIRKLELKLKRELGEAPPPVSKPYLGRKKVPSRWYAYIDTLPS